MKKLAALTGILLSALSGFSTTWTFHSWQDNFVDVTLGDGTSYVDCFFDYSWDAAFPSSADSGVYWSSGLITITPKALTLSVDVAPDWLMTSFYVAQGYPGYNGSWSGIAEPDLTAGEYWIDFASDGSYRISASRHTDFGKWAWDGSLNPSWVEPLAETKHGKALGHTK